MGFTGDNVLGIASQEQATVRRCLRVIRPPIQARARFFPRRGVTEIMASRLRGIRDFAHHQTSYSAARKLNQELFMGGRQTWRKNPSGQPGVAAPE